ncbi:MAG: hypothetical protein JO116_03095, partial [Planctomycetaceae bacterium]|nr:hypothetical protein [Planctomycetaceae bacterium]
MTSDRVAHWFVIPVVMCGVLIGIDGIDWLRGRRDIIDPAGIIGLLGIHIFFLAPLLQVAWDYSLLYVMPPDDWREWLGLMALLNVLGLVVYLFSREWLAAQLAARRPRTVWRIDRERFALVVGLALPASALLQGFVYASYGGLSGYIDAFERDLQSDATSFQGMGWVFMISEAFPILAMMAFAVLVWGRGRRPSLLAIGLVLLAFLALKIVFGGLRGSRSSTVWALFWAVGIIHLRVRPIPRMLVGIGLVFLLAFIYAYGFYKNYGRDALDALNAEARSEMTARSSNRTLEATILSDLGRADIQAYLLFRLTGPAGGDYSYAWGKTYATALALLIPRAVWPEVRRDDIVQQGTEALYGRTTYALQSMRASQVYGLAGEAMLNFGPAAAPVSYLVLGALVALVGHWFHAWDPGDSRRMLLPFLVNFVFVVLVSDS